MHQKSRRGARMSAMQAQFYMALEACRKCLDIIEAAESASGAYHLSPQERSDLLDILTPVANAVNDRYIYSCYMDASAIKARLREQHWEDWEECRKAVVAVEAKVRSGTAPLERDDIPGIRHVFDALFEHRAHLWIRIGGGC